ncbi:hypothetical protein E1B28_005056 [Marasmius oreades]|uniref:Uncharacterized protein n=1 Tax=Marasmius oreades TaxID=181124 RepID=A0A9P8ADF7_9AGAR|nr:uncharacterized protein E1B28_005056 [Marasmius oreades]KAG7097736.1 hypothetical protein E1B28_005056 [Marasmius oreades]
MLVKVFRLARNLTPRVASFTALWDTIAAVGASHNSEIQVKRGPSVHLELVKQSLNLFAFGTLRNASIYRYAGFLVLSAIFDRRRRVDRGVVLQTQNETTLGPSSLVLSIARGLAVTGPTQTSKPPITPGFS